MASVNRRLTVPFRRKREGKTDYRKRLSMLRSGSVRFVVRSFGNQVIAQLVRFDPKGDIVLAQATSNELAKMEWPFKGNMPSAYLTGFLLAKRAKKAKFAEETILDIGLQGSRAGTRVYACLKGCIDGGVQVKHSPEVLPSDERVSGAHIASYAASASGNQFKALRAKGADPKSITSIFAKTKKAIEAVK